MNAKTLTGLLAGVLVAAMGIWPTEGLTMNSDANSIYVPRGGDDRKKLLKAADGWETIRNVYAPISDISDWRELVERRQKGQWKTGKSAQQTALSWLNANPDLPREINALFGGTVELLAATPEHETPLAGRGTGSTSDVLAFVDMRGARCVVTVEGKGDEKFRDTVEAWFKKADTEGSRDNRTKRLNGIYAELGLTNPDTAQIRYQLMHRSAAAVIEAKRFGADCAAMVVQSFSPKHTGLEDFAEFLKLFGIDSAKRDTLYTTDMPGMTLHFGWVSSAGTVAAAPAPSKSEPQPAPVVETVPVTETAASSAEPVAPTPSPQSSQIPPIALIIGGIFVLVLVGGVAFFAWRRSRANAGKAFENYVQGLLCGRENVKLTKPTDKFDYPDFEMTIRDDKRRIFLECKWVKSFYQGNYNVVRDSKKLQKYKAYQKDYEQPFFIVLGVGGTEEKPHHLYTIPLEELPQTKLNYEQLKVYHQKEGSDFSYKPSTNRLTISR